MPWAVDFHERMRLFRAALDAERLHIQGSNDLLAGGPQRSRGVVVRIRKTRVLEDGMEAMARVGASIKDRVVVKYINDFGEEEAGIDAGGLFKDFVTDLSGRIFDPSYGLFCTTAAGLLYPNPAAPVLFDLHEMDQMFNFLGRVLGKALFENITLQPQFAHFFLAFMHGKYNFMNLINDLHTLDPELYKNLMFLKTYEVRRICDAGCSSCHECCSDCDVYSTLSSITLTSILCQLGNIHSFWCE
jgi:ubiquitin-protein ligase E3 C